MDLLTKRVFYARLARFLATRGLSERFRQAALDTKKTYALWDEHWDEVVTFSEHDAALRLAFILMWSLEGRDINQALAYLRQNDDPELLMKRALSKTGHLSFSALDLPQDRWNG
jgi:hypothetical protein